MVLEEVFGGFQVPLFISIVLLFSYLTWSKFKNGGELAIRDVNSILDILAIFFALIAPIAGFAILFISVLGTINLVQYTPEIFTLIQKFIILITLPLFLLFLVSYRHKDPKPEDLERLIKNSLRSQITLFILFFGFFFTFIFSSLFKIFSSKFISLLVLYFLTIIFSWSLVHLTIFQIEVKKVFNFDFLVALIIAFCLGIFLTFISMPFVYHGSSEIVNYKINYLGDKNFEDSYKIIESKITVRNWDLGSSFIPLVLLDYGRYDLTLNTKIQKNDFKIYTIEKKNISKKNSFSDGFDNLVKLNETTEKPYNFSQILVDTNKEKIVLQYNTESRNYVNKIKKFVIRGATEWNYTPEFLYEDNSKNPDICKGETCLIRFRLKNNLSYPLVISRREIFDLRNRGIENISNCKFKDIFSSIEYYNKTTRDGTTCHDNYCELRIYNGESKKQIIQIPLELNIEEEEISANYDWYINDTIDLEVTTFLSCATHSN